MKMESALEVLSRAASIVQSVSTQSPPDAGKNDSVVKDGKRKKCDPGNLLSVKDVHPVIKYEEDSLTNYQKHKSVSTIQSNSHDTEPPHKSPQKQLTAVEYLQKCSQKNIKSEMLPPSNSKGHYVYTREVFEEHFHEKSPEILNKNIKYHDSSSKETCSANRIDTQYHSPNTNYVKYQGLSPKNQHCYESETCKAHERECKLSSPVRVDVENDHLSKRIKIEEPDVQLFSSVSTSPRKQESRSPSTKHCEQSRLNSKANISGSPSKSPPFQIVPHYMQSYPQYPPLFIFTDKPTNYSKLMATYDSIFAPTPPLLPPYLPPVYSKCNCGDKNCKVASPKPPKYEPKPTYTEKGAESTEYSLPNVDEHFRKSLGDKYKLLESEHVNERPSSVDDHFAKALGKNWYTLDCKSKSKCNT